MLTKKWERYFLKQFVQMFVLFLCCFYGLYVLIDYASHANTLAHHKAALSFYDIARYYLFVFSSRVEILIPLALLIALVHTLCHLNVHHELVAFRAAGFSLRLLMKPFIVASLFCTFLIYANEQWILPQALKKVKRFQESTKQKNYSRDITAQNIILEDGSLLLYQQFDPNRDRFFDVFWIKSIDSIYRIKYLYPNDKIPTGQYVDFFERQEEGNLNHVNAYQEKDFPEIKFNPELLQSVGADPDVLPIIELGKLSFFEAQSDARTNEKESKVLTAFYWKLCIPWLCLMAIIAPAPFCVQFSRMPPVFFIYVCSLFAFIAFYMFMDAAQIIAKKEVMSPFWAICGPFFLIFTGLGWRFFRMESV